MKVFLGGTCGKSTWRGYVMPQLICDYFNPVVEDWTPECQEQEIYEREHDDKILYVITADMEGVYSIAEVVDDSNKRPEKTVLCILYEGFDAKMAKSLKAVEKMCVRNGATVLSSLDEVVSYLNSCA